MRAALPVKVKAKAAAKLLSRRNARHKCLSILCFFFASPALFCQSLLRSSPRLKSQFSFGVASHRILHKPLSLNQKSSKDLVFE